jgi:hypothetical protein
MDTLRGESSASDEPRATKPCPFTPCTAILLGAQEIFCWKHWQRVPSDQQGPLRKAHAEMQSQPHNPMPRRRFLDLRLKAIGSIAKALAAVAAPTFRRRSA